MSEKTFANFLFTHPMWREDSSTRVVWLTILTMPNLLVHNHNSSQIEVARRISEASNISIPKVFHAMSIMRKKGIVSVCCNSGWVLQQRGPSEYF